MLSDTVHTGDKLHRYKACGKSFTNKTHLTRHTLIHTGDKPHSCETCGKSFTKKSNLTQHIQIHSGVKPHGCETCGKTFTPLPSTCSFTLVINLTVVKFVEIHLVLNPTLSGI